MVQAEVTVQNYAGIHVRPSGLIIQAAAGYPGSISVEGTGMVTDLTNVMGLIAMGLCQGDRVRISVDGPNEEEMLSIFTDLFGKNYDFPPRGG
ncbi:HPr family phosphocarrier protein [Marispirochaeta sp.]|jgi:phosphocarrier protein HPr|uniref:HPr family phosphocarrier protein n=1 Tax=Marispirochaeta sp. TaxID=2038653 RepID=UPI0029C7A88A|nr:HPr family phosphocarrier protein [Marispirochaeta sp.]